MVNLQLNTVLSNSMMRQLGSTLNKSTGNKIDIEVTENIDIILTSSTFHVISKLPISCVKLNYIQAKTCWIKNKQGQGIHLINKPSLVIDEDSELVPDLIPGMELHLLLGVVNHLFKNLVQCWPEVRDRLAKLKLQMQPFHGSQFTGNECSKLLQSVDILQRMTEKSCTFQAQGFIEFFKNVANSCFRQTLEDSFLEKNELIR